MNKNIKEITLTGLAAALVFVTTMYIKVPNSLGGYFNLGDSMLMLFSAVLNPFYAFVVGGIGSALADVIGGYAQYAIPTLIIKGTEAVFVSYMFIKFGSKAKWIAYIGAAAIMVTGYFLVEWGMYGDALVSLSAVPANIIQGISGAVIALVLLKKVTQLTENYRK
ncbi:ECF transporter S component [Anaerorhabdus sp.]|uniref:ECF transporter S component n=1 Tax=Anaerorhabdus sp. TaxID=1872524 RepID=UPI002FCA910A